MSLSRIRAQLAGLERIVRSLGAELENQISAFSPVEIQSTREIGNGISALLLNGTPLPPVSPDNYERFAPNVCVSIAREIDDGHIIVAMKAAREHDAISGIRNVARLSVHPVFSVTKTPDWVTLETSLDTDDLCSVKEIRVELISHFDLPREHKMPPPRNLAFFMRARKKDDGGYVDSSASFIPVTTMPFEHTLVIREEMIQKMDFENAPHVTAIFGLPQSGIYTFNIDYFSIKGVGDW